MAMDEGIPVGPQLLVNPLVTLIKVLRELEAGDIPRLYNLALFHTLIRAFTGFENCVVAAGQDGADVVMGEVLGQYYGDDVADEQPAAGCCGLQHAVYVLQQDARCGLSRWWRWRVRGAGRRKAVGGWEPGGRADGGWELNVGVEAGKGVRAGRVAVEG
jgi:hypothetical protein